MSMINYSPPGARDEPPDGAVTRGHDQGSVQDSAYADGRFAVWQHGGTGDSREEESHRLSGGIAVCRDRRTGTEHDRTAHQRGSSAAGEDAGRVRLHTVA